MPLLWFWWGPLNMVTLKNQIAYKQSQHCDSLGKGTFKKKVCCLDGTGLSRFHYFLLLISVYHNTGTASLIDQITLHVNWINYLCPEPRSKWSPRSVYDMQFTYESSIMQLLGSYIVSILSVASWQNSAAPSHSHQSSILDIYGPSSS